MSIRWLSIRDIEVGLKKRIYEIENGKNGSVIWDARSRQYVGHIETDVLRNTCSTLGIDIDTYCSLGEGSEWGSSSW